MVSIHSHSMDAAKVSLAADDLRPVRVIGNGTEGMTAAMVPMSHTRNTGGMPVPVSEETCSILIPMLLDYGFLLLKSTARGDRARMMQLMIRQLGQRFNCMYLSLEGMPPETKWAQWFEEKTGRTWRDVVNPPYPDVIEGKLTKRQSIIFINDMEMLHKLDDNAQEELHMYISVIHTGQFVSDMSPVSALIVGGIKGDITPLTRGSLDVDSDGEFDDSMRREERMEGCGFGKPYWCLINQQIIELQPLQQTLP